MGFDEYKPPSRANAMPSWKTNSEQAPVDVKPAEFKDRRGPFIIGLFSFVIGCAVLWGFAILPMIIHEQAKSWPTVQAIIMHSGVETRHNKSTTYGFDVRYRYNFNGQQYFSTHYTVYSCSSSDYSAAQRLVAQYPVGSAVDVYVNPSDPSYALINRGATAADYFAWFPVIFVCIGGYTMQRAATAVYIVQKKTGKNSIVFTDSLEKARKVLEDNRDIEAKNKEFLDKARGFFGMGKK